MNNLIGAIKKMKVSVIFKVIAAIVIFFLLLNLGLKMLSAKDSLLNIASLFVIGGDVLLMYKTRFLTNIKLYKHKNNED